MGARHVILVAAETNAQRFVSSSTRKAVEVGWVAWCFLFDDGWGMMALHGCLSAAV